MDIFNFSLNSSPNLEILLTNLFSFGNDKEDFAHNFRFLSDGTISGYVHKNEKYWEIKKNNELIIKNYLNRETSIFDLSTLSITGQIAGQSLLDKKPLYFHALGKIELRYPDRAPEDFIEYGANTQGSINLYSQLRINEQKLVSVGSFTSLGRNVTVIVGQHDMSHVTTFPFKYQAHEWGGSGSIAWNATSDIEDHVYGGHTTIGSDVWIGNDVTIMGGLTIGDGAVIGANAVVTHDVAPYEVVVGVPARHIKFRFGPAQIAALERIQWWNWYIPMIDARIKDINSRDIDTFIRKYDVI